ncbi:hypothetical protein V6N12_029085 [Hibiscus sabdariffa]|uniref:Retrovirus-related Pol polyprotein from transposon TNT 1-94 n=1 Tax=Hibiscus sabdariffa TaxID=183260 RepID=A0ABR2F7P8_9ROSI
MLWIAVKNILKYVRRTKDVFLVNGGEDTVANSTTKGEYIAASEVTKEAVWIKKFVTELGVVPSISDAMELYCDNNGAIAQAKEPRSHQRSKHILRRFHLIREIIDRGDVEICKVHTDDNIADPLTKPLTQQKHDRHTESLGIRYISPVKIQGSRFLRLNEERVFESEVVDWIEKLDASRSSRVREFVKKICSRFAAYQGTQCKFLQLFLLVSVFVLGSLDETLCLIIPLRLVFAYHVPTPGASINLMPKSVFQNLGIGEAKLTTVMLQLADRSYVQPEGKIEDILVRVDKFIFPTDFLILDCEADEHAPIILGRSFLATSRMLIDFEKGELVLRVGEEQVKINVFSVPGQQDTAVEECKALHTSAERSTRLKPYLGAHTERDKRSGYLEGCLNPLKKPKPYLLLFYTFKFMHFIFSI